MKKFITILFFATALLMVADAQTPATKKNYAKETAKMFKKLSPEAQQRVFEYAEREVKVEAAMAKKIDMPQVATPPPVPPAPVAKTPPPPAAVAATPPPPPAPVAADPHAGHDHAALPAVTPATSPNSDSPEYMVTAEKMAKTTIKWDKDSHDFGKIKEGEKVTHRFTLKNTGSNPLLITMVKPSCGCTSPSWSKEEIAPGKEGYIEIEFNSAGKTGPQRKNVSVYLNTEPIMQSLTFTGEVITPEKVEK